MQYLRGRSWRLLARCDVHIDAELQLYDGSKFGSIPQIPSPETDMAPDDFIEINDHIEDFLVFLYRVDEASRRNAAWPTASNIMQTTLFRPGSAVYKLLSVDSDEEYRADGLGMMLDLRLASLIYIASTLLACQAPSETSERWVKQLERNITTQQVHTGPNLRLLCYTILKFGHAVHLDSPERAWFMVRMVQVVKRLNGETGRKVGRPLLSYLALNLEETAGSEFSEIDAEDIRRQVFGCRAAFRYNDYNEKEYKIWDTD